MAKKIAWTPPEDAVVEGSAQSNLVEWTPPADAVAVDWVPPDDAVKGTAQEDDRNTPAIGHFQNLGKNPSAMGRVMDVLGGVAEMPAAAVGFAGANALGIGAGIAKMGKNLYEGKPFHTDVNKTRMEVAESGQHYTEPQTQTGKGLWKGMAEGIGKVIDTAFESDRFIDEELLKHQVSQKLIDNWKKKNNTQIVPFEIQQDAERIADQEVKAKGGLPVGGPADTVNSFIEEVVKPVTVAGIEMAAGKHYVKSVTAPFKQMKDNRALAKEEAELRATKQAIDVRDQIKAEKEAKLNEATLAEREKRTAGAQKPRQNLPVPYTHEGQFYGKVEPGEVPNWRPGTPEADVTVGLDPNAPKQLGFTPMEDIVKQRETVHAEEANAAARARDEAIIAEEASVPRKPMTSGQLYELDPVTGKLKPVDQGIKGATLDVVEDAGKDLASALEKLRQSGKQPDKTVSQYERVQIGRQFTGRGHGAPLFTVKEVGKTPVEGDVSSRAFDLTANERIALDKHRQRGMEEVAEILNRAKETVPEFKTLSEEAIQQKMASRLESARMIDKFRREYAEWAEKANRMRKAFEQYTPSLTPIQRGVQQTKIKELERLAEVSRVKAEFVEEARTKVAELEALQDSMQQGRPDTSGKNQGPKTRFASTNNKTGQRQKQGGYINFDAFSKDMKDKGIESDPSVLREMYNRMYPTKTPQAMKEEAVGKIPGMSKGTDFNKYESRPVETDSMGKGAVGRMEKAAQHSPDLPEPQGTVNKLMASAGRLPAWAKPSALVHEGTAFITSVKDYYRIKTEDTHHTINNLLNKFEKKLFGSDKRDVAGDVLKLRREHEFNPNFDATKVLSGDALKLWNEIDAAIKDIYQRVNARRKELDPNAQDLPQLPYYFTSFFKGDYAIPVFDAVTNKFLFNMRETTRGSANRAAEWVNQQPGLRADKVSLLQQTKYADKRMDAYADFEALLETFGPNHPEAIAAMQRLAASSNKKAMGTGEMPQRFMTKSGRVGSLGDKPWRSEKENYYDNKEALNRYIEGANEWMAHTTIAKFLENMEKSKAIKQPNAKKMVQDFGDYVIGKNKAAEKFSGDMADKIAHKMGLSGTHVLNGVRRWGNINTALLIGWGSVRATVQNTLQPIQATIPKMLQMAFTEGYGQNPAAIPVALVLGLMEGVLDVSGHWTGLGHRSSLAYKEAHHVVDAHLVEGKGTFRNYHLNAAYDFAANLSVVATEQFARSVSFSMYENFLKMNGISEVKARDMAKNLTHETMVNYEAYAKPQIFGRTGMVGEMAGRLQTYKLNSATQMYEYASKMKAKDPKTWVAFSSALSINIALAGLMGMIGTDVMEALWNGVQAADEMFGDPTPEIQMNSPKRWIYDNMPTLVSMGVLSHATGLNLQGSFATNLVGDSATASLVPMAGFVGQQLQAPLNLAPGLGGNDAAMAKALSVGPSSARPYIEAEFLSTKNGDETQVISPNNPKMTSWKGKGQGYVESGLIKDTFPGKHLYGNLQTLERGKQGIEARNQASFEKDIAQAKASIEKKVFGLTAEMYKAIGNEREDVGQQHLDKITDKLAAYYEFDGDPNKLLKQVTEQLKQLNVGDDLLYKLNKQITVETIHKISRAVERVEKRQEK